MSAKGRKPPSLDPATAAFDAGRKLLEAHSLYGGLIFRAEVFRQNTGHCPPNGWAVVSSRGAIHVHPTRRGTPDEWTYVLAHCLTHLAFGHFNPDFVIGDPALGTPHVTP